MRKALLKKGIHAKKGRVLWYTGNNAYTPDLIIGNVIVEVDGSIHDISRQKILDRIRQRALEKMGYRVYRVKNEQILHPKEKARVVDEIIQIYYEQEGIMVKKKIQLVEAPEFKISIPESLKFFVAEQKINMHPDNWSPTLFKQIFEGTPYDPTDYGIMQSVMLQLFGHYLSKKAEDDGRIDFEEYAMLYDKGVKLMSAMFDRSADVYFRNVFLVSTANFFKNLVFYGGPRVKHGLISINDAATLDSNIDSFNRNFAKFGIVVDRKDIAIECEDKLMRLGPDKVQKVSWVKDWTTARLENKN